MKHLWNTNTVIYYLQQRFPQSGEQFIDDILKEGQPIISAITEIELLCWRSAIEKDIAVIKRFINDSFVIELEKPIKLKTADLRKDYKIKLPDAIIAATAIVYDLILITRNTSDFKNITGLQLKDPYDG